MFSVNRLPCSGHSLSGPWGCESLINSVVMKPPVRTLRGQSSLCDLPLPSASVLSGNISYKFHRKGSSPWWGLWIPGHEPLPCAVSLFPSMSWCQRSFWDPPPHPYSKQRFQDIPWRLSGELPSPHFRNLAQPHRSGRHALNITQRALWKQGRHTLPQTWGS